MNKLHGRIAAPLAALAAAKRGGRTGPEGRRCLASRLAQGRLTGYPRTEPKHIGVEMKTRYLLSNLTPALKRTTATLAVSAEPVGPRIEPSTASTS
jgi:hypothetical protein